MTKPAKRPPQYLTDDLNWDEFLKELRAGTPLMSLARRADLPSYHLFRKRLVVDPEFAAIARPLLRLKPLPPEAFQTALNGLKAGRLLKDVLGGVGQPNRRQWERRQDLNPAFAAEVERVLRDNKSRAYVSAAEWERILAVAEECESFAQVVKRVAPSPSAEGIAAKLRRDAAYAARFPVRCLRPARIAYAAEVFEAAVRAVESGVNLSVVEKMPGMPSRGAIMARATARPDLASRLAPHIAPVQKYFAPDILQSIQTVGGEVSFRDLRGLGLAPRDAVYRWRKRNEAVDALARDAVTRVRLGAVRRFDRSSYEQALRLLQEGRSPADLSGEGLPKAESLRRYARAHPEFAQRLQGLRLYRDLAQADRDNSFARALSQNEIYAAVDRVLGRGLDPHVREEVRSEMILAVLDGYLATDEITPQTAREFVTDYHREAGTWSGRSMDAPMFSDSGRSLHDVVGA